MAPLQSERSHAVQSAAPPLPVRPKPCSSTEQFDLATLLHGHELHAKDGHLPADIRHAALRVLASCVPGWGYAPAWGADDGVSAPGEDVTSAKYRPVAMSKFHMHTLTGGMTNIVFRCEKPSGLNRVVLLRCYGQGTDAFFNRENDMLAFRELAKLGLGPQLLGEFSDGRVEEFLEAETLTPVMVRSPRFSCLIATQLAAMHRLHPRGLDREPQLWHVMSRWYNMASAAGVTYSGIDVQLLGQCIKQLQTRLQSVDSPTVFCHNDLQYGNLMFKSVPDCTGTAAAGSDGTSSVPHMSANDTTDTAAETVPAAAAQGTLYLIDYEYACYNPRGFDIGNHFCEWGADYHSPTPHLLDWAKFPSLSEQQRFCAAYLGTDTTETGTVTDDHTTELGTEIMHDAEQAAAAVQQLVREAQEYSLASHLLWACWGLAQSQVSSIVFDYVGYAQGRLQAYLHFAELFSQQQ